MNSLKNSSTEELMRSLLYNINLLQDTNHVLRENLLKFEYSDPSRDDLNVMNNKWHSGLEALKEIQNVQMVLSDRVLDGNFQSQIKILNDNIKTQVKDFQNYLKQIKESNMLESHIMQKKRSSSQELEEQLLQNQQVYAHEVLDQRDFVNEREKNIEEIDKAIAYIKTAALLGNQIVREDGEKIDFMLNKQDQHKHNLENKIKVDLKETERIQSSMCRKVLCWGILLILILVSVIALLFVIKK